MYRYCTEVLHFSEATAFHRIRAARAARAYPLLLERIREGAIHLAGAMLLAPELTPENHVELLDSARHKSKRAIEELLANRAPKPDVPARVRKLPDPRPTPPVRMPLAIAEPTGEAPRREAAPAPPVPRAQCTAATPLGGKRSRSSSLAARRSATSSVKRRHCSAIRFRTATSRRSSIEPSACCSRTRSGRSSPRRRPPEIGRGLQRSPERRPDVSRRRSSVLSWRGTKVCVRLSRRTVAAAALVTSSSSITWTPGPRRSSTRSTESSSAVGATTTTQRCKTMDLGTWRASQCGTTAPGSSST